MGKEWTTSNGEFQHTNPMWVKIVSSRGDTKAVNWIENFKKLRQSVNIEFPGKENLDVFFCNYYFANAVFF